MLLPLSSRNSFHHHPSLLISLLYLENSTFPSKMKTFSDTPSPYPNLIRHFCVLLITLVQKPHHLFDKYLLSAYTCQGLRKQGVRQVMSWQQLHSLMEKKLGKQLLKYDKC